MTDVGTEIPGNSREVLEQWRILIIDRHQSNSQPPERLLRDAGYEHIHTSTDPTQALDLCDRIKPDLLLLDLPAIPLEGFDLIVRLQQLPLAEQPPILVLTDDVTVDARRRALSLGARDALVRPLDHAEVLLRVQNLLETRQLRLQIERQHRLLLDRDDERTALIDQVQQANGQLEVATDASTRFLTGMSHELRTPLNAILGFTGTVLMGLAGPLNDEQTHQLRTVQSSGRHLLSLINDLLDLATIESGRDALTVEPIDCTALLHEVAATFRTRADEKGIRLLVEVDQGLEIRSDQQTLKQILINLTSNAINFTDHGEVALRLDQRSEEADRVAVFTVRDTGRGVTPSDQDQLFDPFAQIGSRHGHPDAGTGLGLYISQTLATLLGGVISVQSEFGSGSTFTLELSANGEPVAKHPGL